ncbi:MAG: carboxylesterase family protein [Leptospiraceae bacterium]|nr:carboxylesterase family protein [Leptospiraceae bacterium]
MQLRHPGFFTLHVLLVAGFLSCGQYDPPATLDRDAVRSVEQGVLVGGSHLYNSHVWYGIPYAAPPIGRLRWQAPAPAKPWTGERQAVDKPSECVQLAGAYSSGGDAGAGEYFGSEDCLYLNIHAPRFAPDSVPSGKNRLPVMVWIHGGSNYQGSGADYHGGNLASTHDVIVVTVNYRLGPMGWFFNPAASGAGGDEDSGNFAILDLIAALKWIRANISAFGGDPDQITVFGESAGGNNVLALLLSSKARGLFKGAIVQSAYPRPKTTEEAALPLSGGGSENSSGEVLLHLLVAEGKASDIADARKQAASMSVENIQSFLRSLEATRIIDAYRNNLNGENPEASGYSFPTLIQDGKVLPKGDWNAMVRAGGPVSSVPILIGGNRDEQKLYLALDDRFTSRRFFNLSINIFNPELYDATARHATDGWSVIGVHEPLRALRSVNRNVYAYRFDWDEEPTVVGNNLGQLLGAAHAFEIPFVFGHFHLGPADRYMFSDENLEGRLHVSEAMMSYWAGFAYDGAPGRGISRNQPEWKRAGDENRFMVFDTVADGGVRMMNISLDAQTVLRNIASDPVLKKDGWRCVVYRYMEEKERFVTKSDLERLGCREDLVP